MFDNGMILYKPIVADGHNGMGLFFFKIFLRDAY